MTDQDARHDGDTYRAARNGARLTQIEIAERAGCSLSTVIRAEAREDWRGLRHGLVLDLKAALAGRLAE